MMSSVSFTPRYSGDEAVRPSNWKSAFLNSLTPWRAQSSTIFSNGSLGSSSRAVISTAIEEEKTTPLRRPLTLKLAKIASFLRVTLVKRMILFSAKFFKGDLVGILEF